MVDTKKDWLNQLDDNIEYARLSKGDVTIEIDNDEVYVYPNSSENDHDDDDEAWDRIRLALKENLESLDARELLLQILRKLGYNARFC